MRAPWQTVPQAQNLWRNYIEDELKSCTIKGLGHALHAMQDSFAPGHSGFQEWGGGIPSPEHREGDINPPASALRSALGASIDLIERYKKMCPCECE